MYACWNVVLLASLLCQQAFAFDWKQWTAFAATFASESQAATSGTSYRRVAIIGAGAGGSSAAYHLQRFANISGIEIDLTVYEKNSYIGGRVTTVNAYNKTGLPVELGGSIFVAVNELLVNATKEFGLRTDEAQTEIDDVLGVWNGDIFVHIMKDSGWQWWDSAKLLWKYGMAPVRTVKLMRSVVAKFRKLYEPPFFPFRSLSERAQDLDLIPATGRTGRQFLEENGILGDFPNDLIQASTRVNYAQNLDLIHGLETMVCMAIDGAMSVQGGNWQIFDGMVKSSHATTLLNTSVDAITKLKGQYSVQSTSIDADSAKTYKNELYDTVVLAAPYQFSDIDIEEGLLKKTPDQIPYVNLHVTLLTSSYTFSPEFFGLPPGAEVPTSILTTLGKDEIPRNIEEGAGKAGFFVLSTMRSLINPATLQKEILYKFFTPEAVTSEFLSKLFNTPMPHDLTKITPSSGDSITWFYPHVWHSYPYEYPRVTFEDSVLAKDFYYTGGMDSFISTMETNALMGKNVAQLAVDSYLDFLQGVDVGKGDMGQKPLVKEDL